LGDIFCCSDTQYNTSQTAVHISVNHYLVLLVTCTVTAAIVRLDIMLIYADKHNHCHYNHRVLGFFVVTAMLYTSMVLVLGIGITGGQYHWVLGIGCLSWYISIPTSHVYILRVWVQRFQMMAGFQYSDSVVWHVGWYKHMHYCTWQHRQSEKTEYCFLCTEFSGVCLKTANHCKSTANPNPNRDL